MDNIFKSQKRLGFVLVAIVIALHGFLRFSEIPHAFSLRGSSLLGDYFWIPSINLAAGKGFTEDRTFLQKSPELANFLKQALLETSPPDVSPFNTVHRFTDYTPEAQILTFSDSIGYRYTLGMVWKYCGFNWLFVCIIQYLFSLASLLSLMYCSHKILGISCSLILGLFYAISPIDIYYVANFGRDGYPLWFTCYLMSTLILFVNRPLTLRRLLGYATSIGLLIYAATLGRLSCIYFLPLMCPIYLIIFFFGKNEIQFSSAFFLKNPFVNKAYLFFIAMGLTGLCTLLPYLLTLHYYPMPPGWTPHIIFLGLGVWGGLEFHPSQVRYLDETAAYMASDYGRRVFHMEAPYTSAPYGKSLFSLYGEIIKNYPFFFLRHVMLDSIYNTLVHLGHFSSSLNGYGKFLQRLFFAPFFFVTSLIGTYLLYFRFKLKKVALILLFFSLYNALTSPLQYGYRHVLMGYPAYYFLSSVTFGFALERIVFYRHRIKKAFLLHQKAYILSLSFILLAPLSIVIALQVTKRIEASNIRKMQIFFHFLNKHPFVFDRASHRIKFPPTILKKTLGLYCEMGGVTAPREVIITMPAVGISPYTTKITPVIGKNVTLFFPIHIMNEDMSVIIEDNNQCKAFYWADLKEWKGPLWEGTYDEDKLPKEPVAIQTTNATSSSKI